jgi:hypothetical protein
MTRLLLAGVALLSISSPAHAHTLLCECWELAGKQVQCKGGFAHGAPANGVTVDVIGYDEKTLVAGRFADDSTFTFKRPDGEFYVLMDMGAGHTLEIDHSKIMAKQ